jgi:DNA-binding SARP family transcriptional activator/tetratricopeptide (TPR) repeat protein
MSKLEMVLLGPPQFKLDGRPITNKIASKSQALIAYLAVTRQAHSRESVAGLLWGEMTEANARRNLRVALTKLRGYFDDNLVIQRRTLAFNTESDYWLDVELFEACLHPPEPTVQQLKTAVDLYHGPFLAELPLRDALAFEEWIRPYQERLRQLAMDALYRLAVHYTQQQQYTRGIDYLGRLLTLEPWLEEAHRQLMRLLVLSGQRSAALAQYEWCRDVLAEELGIEPAETTVALYQQILQEEVGVADDLAETAIRPVTESMVKWSPPFQAPARTGHFVGREALQEKIIEQLKTGGGNHAMVGMGGIGKTTLAAHIAHIVQEQFEDGVLWANAATGEPMAILESWAQLYGYDFAQVSDLETIAAAFRSVLTDKQVLIVLDDVTSISRIRPLLPGNQAIPVLMTTRDQDLAQALNARLWPLEELKPENGRLLLTHILGEERVNAEVEAAREICELLHNLPLAVEIVAQRLKSRSRRRLADVAARLRNETERLSELRLSDREVRASFALSYDSLDMELRRIFALTGLFGGRPFTAAALAAVAGQDRYIVEDRIFSLAALSLIREDGEMRYSQHPLLADFAREALGEALEENGRLAQYYLDFVHQHQRDYDSLRPEWDNIMAAMHTAYHHQLWPSVIEFADALHDAWFTRGRFTQARQGYRWAYTAAQKLNHTLDMARISLNWGKSALEQRDHEATERHLNNCLAHFQQLNEANGMAIAYCELARLALEKADYANAQLHLNQSKKIWTELESPSGLAETLFVEARINYFQGNYKQTELLAEKAINLLTDLPYSEHTLILTLSLRASTAIWLGQLDKAEAYALHALQLCERIGETSERAIVLDVLAEIYRRQGMLAEAYERAQQSLALIEKTGDLGSKAQVLFQLSRIHKEKGLYKKALEYAEQSLQLCQELYYLVLKSFVLVNIGEIQMKLDHMAEAHTSLHQALSIGEELQHLPAIQLAKRQIAALDSAT